MTSTTDDILAEMERRATEEMTAIQGAVGRSRRLQLTNRELSAQASAVGDGYAHTAAVIVDGR